MRKAATVQARMDTGLKKKADVVLKKIGLTDLVTTRGFESTRNSQYKKPGRFADYMLVSDPLLGARFDVVHDPEVSDHCPLLLEIGAAD